MVDNIENIRQLMAEQRYIEAQQLIEKTLLLTSNQELLGLYIEIHLLQGISLPYDLTIKFLNLITDEPHQSLELIEKLSYQGIDSKVLAIKNLVKLGDLESLYQKISDFYLFLYEEKIPRVFAEIKSIRMKYFANDFPLELRELVLAFDQGWSPDFEKEVKRIIQETFQRYNLKNRNERLLQLEKTLASLNSNNGLKIYTHLLTLYNKGITANIDYKKIIELVLYLDEMPLQAILLNLFNKLELLDVAEVYAKIIKNNKDYSFVHYEKYFPHLKSYFLEAREKKSEEVEAREEIDLTLEGVVEDAQVVDWEDDLGESSDLAMTEGLKYLDYEIPTWLNLAVGFIQSDFSRSALHCAKKVKELSSNDTDFLKGSYLAVHALMKLKDYRLALDYCYEALERSKLEADILSFSYLEVDLLLKLREKESALRVLKSIQKIDNTYRMSSKMLKRLNEI